MTYKLYGIKDTATLAPLIILEEAGVEYEAIDIDISNGQNQSEDYLAINPNGLIPSLVCEDGQIIYETAAIMLYLAERHGLTELAPPAGHKDRALFLRTLFYLSNTVHSVSNVNFNAERYVQNPAGLSELTESSLKSLLDCWKPIENLLVENGPFCLGDTCTLLDIYVFLVSRWHEPAEELFDGNQAMKRCCNLVSERASVKKALALT